MHALCASRPSTSRANGFRPAPAAQVHARRSPRLARPRTQLPVAHDAQRALRHGRVLPPQLQHLRVDLRKNAMQPTKTTGCAAPAHSGAGNSASPASPANAAAARQQRAWPRSDTLRANRTAADRRSCARCATAAQQRSRMHARGVESGSNCASRRARARNMGIAPTSTTARPARRRTRLNRARHVDVREVASEDLHRLHDRLGARHEVLHVVGHRAAPARAHTTRWRPVRVRVTLAAARCTRAAARCTHRGPCARTACCARVAAATCHPMATHVSCTCAQYAAAASSSRSSCT